MRLDRDCGYALLSGCLLGLLVVIFVLASLGCLSTEPACEGNWESVVGTIPGWAPNLGAAQMELVPWTADDDGRVVYALVSEWTCCDCGLVHRMAFVPEEMGMRIYIWRLEPETRKERRQRGIFDEMYRDPWSTETQHPE